MKTTSLEDLIGQRLTSVTFIHDYVQLGFENYYGMSIFNPIRLMGRTGEIDESQFGFKDSLCGFINHTVSNVEYEQEKRAAFVFDDGGVVSIGLAERDYSGPEALVLQSGVKDAPILVIRIGD